MQALEAQATKKVRRDAAPAAGAKPTPAPAAAGAAAVAGAASAKTWAKGTGYGSAHSGSSYSEVWDAKATRAAQEAQDQQLQEVLERLVGALGESLGGDVVPPEGGNKDSGKEGAAAEKLVGASGSSGAGSSAAGAVGGKEKGGGGGKGDRDVVMTEAEGSGGAGASTSAAAAAADVGVSNGGVKSAKSSPESEEEVVKGIQESVLLPWLSYMLSESLTQLVERWKVYLLVLRVVQQLCRPSTEALLVGQAAAPVRGDNCFCDRLRCGAYGTFCYGIS